MKDITYRLAERIENFIEQCDGFITTDDGSRADTPVLVGKDIEKFAELIVRECVEVCKSRAGNSDYNTGRMHCVSDLKEHFGVKE